MAERRPFLLRLDPEVLDELHDAGAESIERAVAATEVVANLRSAPAGGIRRKALRGVGEKKFVRLFDGVDARVESGARAVE